MTAPDGDYLGENTESESTHQQEARRRVGRDLLNVEIADAALVTVDDERTFVSGGSYLYTSESRRDRSGIQH